MIQAPKSSRIGLPPFSAVPATIKTTLRDFVISLYCLLSLFALCSYAQEQNALCSHGDGSFHAELRDSSIAVQVGPTKDGGLATRSCEAMLLWSKGTLQVATNAAEIDLDAFGVDLGLQPLVAAFQIKPSANDCCMQYRIYSLDKSPRLLQTISGGSSFRAVDTDLDGRVEIWTEDAAVLGGFEGLSLAEFDSPPEIVLRFSGGQLFDATSEFQQYFDGEISRLQAGLSPDDLRDFKNSDGTLTPDAAASIEQQHRLRGVKVKVLEIVWDYLDSGRQELAWKSLSEMWPARDVVRIRAEILSARARGISALTHGADRSPRRTKHAAIVDAISVSPQATADVASPQPILLSRPPLTSTPDQRSGNTESILNLVVDSAGKVHSAEAAGKAAVDSALICAAAGWKFIPAFKEGRPVACHTRFSVSLRQ